MKKVIRISEEQLKDIIKNILVEQTIQPWIPQGTMDFGTWLDKVNERKRKNSIPLQKFVGKSVNLYNDPSEQIFYRKEVIESIIYDDYPEGSRGINCVYINTKSGDSYKIICLSDRLSDYLVVSDIYNTENTSKKKYNSKFVNEVKSVSPTYCKKPKADYSSIEKNNTQTQS